MLSLTTSINIQIARETRPNTSFLCSNKVYLVKAQLLLIFAVF